MRFDEKNRGEFFSTARKSNWCNLPSIFIVESQGAILRLNHITMFFQFSESINLGAYLTETEVASDYDQTLQNLKKSLYTCSIVSDRWVEILLLFELSLQITHLLTISINKTFCISDLVKQLINSVIKMKKINWY